MASARREAGVSAMTGLDQFTFVVLAVLVAAGLGTAFVLGGLPGRIAEKREHHKRRSFASRAGLDC